MRVMISIYTHDNNDADDAGDDEEEDGEDGEVDMSVLS